MEVIGIQTPVIKTGDDLVKIILKSIEEKGEKLKENDVLIIASSVVSTANGRIQKIADVEPSKQAKKLAEKSGLPEKFVEIIVQEADDILSPSEKCILTLKDEMLRINAGVDRTNVPAGNALLIPEEPEKKAAELREKLEEKSRKKLGVVIADSHVQPLRLGTTGQALGSNGIKESLDFRNRKDLYGRKLQITFRGIGDQIAAAAQLIMGEADESIPVVILRGAKAAFSDKPEKSLKVAMKDCVYSKFFNGK
ncbi:hypothetical protein AKJ57_01575 [candidate division MSBL1 archaeon SCGC-AAA259A05]|uniref:Coenzyme F420:L-glutamate ligase-like domain-containing protein n=1 Tax=candidate division MSBL1 archaeon SCGC-AAA259A05 TaxID=1698259 RepID=A0A133UB00_9EURY|nr:hypothetical protein AKJ57_01575 [candidate division MSBL1 archaeon SCGC-AAA259A05]